MEDKMKTNDLKFNGSNYKMFKIKITDYLMLQDIDQTLNQDIDQALNNPKDMLTLKTTH